MTVAVDITSRLSYVPSVNCSDPFCTSHNQYDSSASSTYQVRHRNGTQEVATPPAKIM